jgi:hypothetical protein
MAFRFSTSGLLSSGRTIRQSPIASMQRVFGASHGRLASSAGAAARPTLISIPTVAAIDGDDGSRSQTRQEENECPTKSKPDRVGRILKSLGMHSSQLEAGPDFNRWKLVAAATTNHMCLGSIYAWSLFNQPLTRLHGVVAPGTCAVLHVYDPVGPSERAPSLHAYLNANELLDLKSNVIRCDLIATNLKPASNTGDTSWRLTNLFSSAT